MGVSKKKPKKVIQNPSVQKKQEMAETYAGLVEGGIYFPTRTDLRKIGISREMMRHHFGNMSNLRSASKEIMPDSFEGSVDIDEYVSSSYIEHLQKEIKKHKRFLITTAVSGQKVHDKFLESMRFYCKENKAKLFILPSHDPAHNLDRDIDWHFDPAIVAGNDLVFEETYLNSNFFISGIRVTAKQINPITGLNEISQVKGSCILASPKQFLEYDSVSANKLPHARMTSGACTIPNYKTTLGTSLRTGYLAEHQHTIGAVIVEIQDDNIYHFRQIQAANDGTFCDLGKEYSPTKSRKLSKEEAPVLVMGDYHAGEHDETAVKAWIEAINQLGIEEVVFHDMFNGVSVNPHEEEDIMLRAERARKGLNVLENEIAIASEQFDRILGLPTIKKGIVVKSNHDDMIDRWLRKVKYAKDPVNFEFATELAANLIAASKKGIKKDFFKTGLELVKNPKYADKLQWLTVDEDYTVGGVHLGAHGDRSSNGARGSIKGLAKSYPRCIIGHSHTPGIFKGAWQVGTSSLLRLGYNKGASSWVHTSCLLYKNGQRQLLNSIEGAYKLAV